MFQPLIHHVRTFIQHVCTIFQRVPGFLWWSSQLSWASRASIGTMSLCPWTARSWFSHTVGPESKCDDGKGVRLGLCAETCLITALICTILVSSIVTVSARIIERSQEDKSTVKYRTFVLLRVPIRSGVGKFNYRTGRRTKVRYFTVLLSSWLRSIISGTDMIFTAYLYIYNL